MFMGKLCQGKILETPETEMAQEPKYQVGQIVSLKSGTQHRIYAVYEFKADRGFRYATLTVKPDGTIYGPWRNITDKTPIRATA